MAWLCEMANAVIGDNGELLEYKHLIANPKTRATWLHSYGNEIGRLAQGMPGRNTGTNTIFFIRKDQVPKERAKKDTTYGLITTLVRPEKIDEPNRTLLVAGGDRVHYPGDAGTPTADLLTVKLLLNSIISKENARFMTMDIKDFYLNTPMACYEYMRIQLADMPDDVVEHYKLRELATPDGEVYCEIRKGMYGLPQAGIIAQKLLEERLAKHGYCQSATTPGLWKHDTRPICFSLVVDDFGVKYVGEEHAQHLLETIRKYYKCSADWQRGAILRTHHKVGLHRPEGPSVDARLCSQSSRSVPTPTPHETSTPTISTRQAQLWRKDPIRKGSRHIPPAGQGRQEVYTGGVRSFPVLGTRSRWRITRPSQRTGIPASESDGGNDEINQTIFGLHVHDGGSDTHIPRKRYGPRHPQRRLVLV